MPTALLAKLTPGEVEAVLAHELGHFKHKHVIKRIVSMFAISLAGFALLGWLSTQMWFYLGLGVRPSMGAWVVYGLGTDNKDLPGFITINPAGQGGAQNFGSAFLPA